AVLHLLALSREIGVPLTIDDFDSVSRRTPLIADLKPGGQFTAVDLDRAGGMGLIIQRLLARGCMDGNARAADGKPWRDHGAKATWWSSTSSAASSRWSFPPPSWPRGCAASRRPAPATPPASSPSTPLSSPRPPKARSRSSPQAAVLPEKRRM